jgi:tetrapyrrole methylase family protein/MazG family protein
MLLTEGIAFDTCDDLYEKAFSFDELYRAIARRAADLEESAVFAVPGHPMVGEESVRLLAEMRAIDVYPAPSFVDAVLAAAKISFSGSLQVWNAHEPDGVLIDPRSSQVVYQLDSSDAASYAKLSLMKRFPESHRVFLVARAGGLDEVVEEIELCELDRRSYDPLTSAFVPPIEAEFAPGFYGLVHIVDTLLGPNGCP